MSYCTRLSPACLPSAGGGGGGGGGGAARRADLCVYVEKFNPLHFSTPSLVCKSTTRCVSQLSRIIIFFCGGALGAGCLFRDWLSIIWESIAVKPYSTVNTHTDCGLSLIIYALCIPLSGPGAPSHSAHRGTGTHRPGSTRCGMSAHRQGVDRLSQGIQAPPRHRTAPYCETSCELKACDRSVALGAALELPATSPGLAATKLRPCLIMSGLSCITWHARASHARRRAACQLACVRTAGE